MNTTQIWWMVLAMINAFSLGLQVSRMLPKGRKVTGTDVLWVAFLATLVGTSTIVAVTA